MWTTLEWTAVVALAVVIDIGVCAGIGMFIRAGRGGKQVVPHEHFAMWSHAQHASVCAICGESVEA